MIRTRVGSPSALNVSAICSTSLPFGMVAVICFVPSPEIVWYITLQLYLVLQLEPSLDL